MTANHSDMLVSTSRLGASGRGDRTTRGRAVKPRVYGASEAVGDGDPAPALVSTLTTNLWDFASSQQSRIGLTRSRCSWVRSQARKVSMSSHSLVINQFCGSSIDWQTWST